MHLCNTFLWRKQKNFQPVQIHQDRGYVVVFPYTSNKARGGVLNILKLL